MAGLDVWRRVGGPQTNAPDPAPPGPAGSVAVSILPTAFTGGATNTVAIQFHARGSEHAFSFSLNFDPASLTFVGARAGADLIGGLLFVNTNEAASGRVGFTLALAPGSQFAEDVRQIVLARFASAPVPICTTTALSFGDQPLPRLASGAQAQSLGTTWTGASIGIAPHGPLLLLISPPHPDGDIDLWIRSADGAPLTPAHAAGIRVYATTNLSVPLANWPVVSNALVPDNGMLRVEGIDNAEVPYRFFRAVGCQ